MSLPFPFADLALSLASVGGPAAVVAFASYA
jgi:hypothetical protein